MKLRRRALLGVSLLNFGSAWAQDGAVAAPAELAADLPKARLSGSGRLTFIGLHIYDARLWIGEAGVPAQWQTVPFALELIYARTLFGGLIAERSLTEMKRQGAITDTVAQGWLDTMKSLFPDVKGGDRITGINVPGRGARFFANGQLRGEPMDADFARVFFGIWLSPLTSEPALRKALLGLGA